MTTTPSEPAEKPAMERSVTAADLSRVIRRFAHIFSTGDLGNLATSEALADLAEFLYGLGSTPVSKIRADKKPERPLKQDRAFFSYKTLSLAEVDALLSDEKTSKSALIHMGRTRFGMPESRLRRLPIAEVVEAVRAAAHHEQSLDLIEKNAEASGRARQS